MESVGSAHVPFRDVDLNAQRREAGDVGGDAGEIQVQVVNDMHLQANAVDGNAAAFEILDHLVDRV